MIDRIKQIMEYYNLSPALLAEQIGINRSNLTHLFSGRNQPSLELAKKILHCFPEVKTEWLIMGVGDMMRSAKEKELDIKIQNERKLYLEENEPDLFTEPQPKPQPPVKPIFDPAPEYAVASEKKVDEQIFDSKHDIEKEEKVEKIEKEESLPVTPSPVEKEVLLSHPSLPTVNKIVFFYSDSSFEVFHPR